MPENTVTTKMRMVFEGTNIVIEQYEDLNEQAEKLAENIKQADQAAKGFNSTTAQAPDMPLQADFWSSGSQSQMGTQLKEASKSIEKAGESTVEFGKASEMLYSALDSVVPGLGGIAESLISLNPVAIAGTAALTGVALAFAEVQRQAEETRKAAEDLIAAEQERVIAQLDIDQRVNLAMEGNKAARESVIKDLANNVATATSLSAQQANLEEQKLKAEQDLVDAKKQMEEALNNLNLFDQSNLDAADKAFNDANARIDEATKSLEELSPQISTNETQFKQLTEASKTLGITAEENAAVMKSVTTGVEGANEALDNLWDTTKKGPTFLDDAAKSIEDGLKKIGKGVVNAAEQTLAQQEKARAEAEERLIKINADLTNVESERGKVLADRITEDSRAAAFAQLDQRLKYAQEYDAQQAKAAKLKSLQDEANSAEATAQQKFFENQQKTLASYLKAEQQATQDYSRERVRKLEDLYNTLGDLASKRDVAGFVNARRAGMTDIARGDEDQGISAQKRRAAYEQAAADQQAAYEKERSQRQSQLQQRIQQEQQAAQQQITATQRAQQAIAALRDQYAKQDLAARRMQEDMTYRQTVDILQKKRAAELTITAGAAAGVVDILSKARDAITRFGSGIGQLGARSIPRFDTGTPYVTRTGLAVIHEGERVMTAAENARYMRGGRGGGGMGPVTINMNVGEIATPSQIAAVEERIVSAIESYAANSNN